MWTAVRLSRSSNLYPAFRFSFFPTRLVSFALNADDTTSPFSELTGTTGVEGRVRNMSFCVLRPYDPLATRRVDAEKLWRPSNVNWWKALLGALLMVFSVPVPVGPVAQFCHDIDATLLVKNEP